MEGTWHILGNGIHLQKKEVEFLPYLKVKKIENLSVFELASLGAKGFNQWALIEPFCYSSNLFEIVSLENNSELGYDVVNRAWLLNTLLVLRNHTQINSIALLNRSWNDIKDLDKNTEIKANLCDYHVSMLQINTLQQPILNDMDVLWISKNFETVNHLAYKSEKFRYALEVINSWRYCVDVRSAIAIIWAAIESIVVVSSEITYRLSLSISSLLIERGDKRIGKFKEIKSLYNLRSKVVHGSNIKGSEVEDALIGSFNLLSELIVFMIEKNKVIEELDFTNAIFK